MEIVYASSVYLYHHHRCSSKSQKIQVQGRHMEEVEEEQAGAGWVHRILLEAMHLLLLACYFIWKENPPDSNI